MAHLFSRDRNPGTESRRRSMSITVTPLTITDDLHESKPFGELSNNLTSSELRETAYEIFVGACRSSGGKPLTYIPQSERSPSFNSQTSSINSSFSSGSLQRSLTSTAASKVKKALGMKSKLIGMNSGGKESKKIVTIGELMRIQMKISEASDSRIRRGLLRSFAGQLGKRIESMVLPLELLQQLKSSEFIDQHEYEAWQIRNMKVLEAGLLLHPHLQLDKSDTSAQRLRQIIKGAMDKPIETGKNSESMQVLRSAVMSLACRSFNGVTDTCHWADGFPLNLRLYQMLLEACFDTNDETTVIEEIDEVLELIKKTWAMLGMNQLLHNLCFAWVLFVRYVSTGQTDNELLFAADNQLAEVAKDAKVTKDPIYSKILSSVLSSIQGWAEKRLLAYHDTFHDDNIESMENVVSLGVSAAKILVEDISLEYRRKRKEVVDVARDRVDTYIRSSLRTAFAQRMEKADLSRRASRNKGNLLSRLSILANDISELATNEKEVFSPILKRWHPHAAGVGVATLHSCYGNELKQFISGITELTPDAIQTLRAADKLEKDLVQIAVEESVDSDDGGKSIIREMPPYEAEIAISNLVKVWIKSRIDILKEWVDRNLQQETWSSHANSEKFAPSAVEVLRIIDETLDAFFLLPILTHQALLPDLVAGLDRSLLHYITKTKSGCGTRNSFLPTMPALTRCTMGSKFSVWKKKEKLQVTQKRKSQVGDTTIGISELCVRLNTLQHIRTEFENMERRIVTYLRNTESAFTENIVNGSTKRFDLSPPGCLEGIQQLSESLAYKIVFHELSYVLYEGLYVGDPSFTRIEPFLKELEQKLEMIVETVHARVRTRVITEIMKASFDGFILVLLAGGPTRSFTIQDYRIIDEDFKGLKDLFWSNGDGLPDDLIDKHSKTVREILPLFKTDTEGLIQRFRTTVLEAYGGSTKTRLPLPATSGLWSPTEPNTLLRALCYRHDEAASKFLKKTYNLPKKL